MDKSRMINTKFWSDSYISELDPIEKLLYLYLLSNERTNICGIYELPLKFMSMETGIEKEMLLKVLARFERDEKVFIVNDYVIIKNFIKNQNIRSESIKIAISRKIAELPLEIRKSIHDGGTVWGRCIHGVYTMWGNGKGKGKGNGNQREREIETENDTIPTSPDFDLFWESYPNKIKKAESVEVWKKKKIAPKLQEILKFIELAKQTDAWMKGYIPSPKKFLEGERWMDDLKTYKDFSPPPGQENRGQKVLTEDD